MPRMSLLTCRGRRLVAPALALLLLGGMLAAWSSVDAQSGKAAAKKAARPKASSPLASDVMVPGVGGTEQVALINQMLEQQWEENEITPSDRCSDYEFIRRASLDIIGRIAKVHEIEQFLRDPPRERRSRLVERLLASDEYASNWANIWSVLLLTRRGVPKVYQQQLHAWLEEKLREDKAKEYVPAWDKIVTELLTASGRTNENGAVNFILAHMGDRIPNDPETNGTFDFVPVTSRTTRLFLGLRTQCVQCHDHPFSGEWGQHHFWGINAFFRQVDAPQGRPTAMNNAKKALKNQQFTLEENANLNNRGIVSYERRSGVLLYTDPTFLNGKKIPLKPGVNRRAELAKLITTDPYFPKAFVNRMWGHFFGRSFTRDAVDDFGEHNPPSNPELLNRLAEDWATRYNHNPKDLIRWICNSRAYGLSSVANKTNDTPDAEAFFSRMLLKAMSPEQLFESLMVATNAKVGQAPGSRQALRDDWLDRLIVNFGDDEGNETTFNGTVVQALLLMNGKDINDAIMDEKEGTVATVLKLRAYSPTAARDAVKDLFLAALNRPPTAEEYRSILNPRVMALPLTRQTDRAAFWKGFYQDLFWAILNSSEFYLNH